MSPTRIIGSLVYRTRGALNQNAKFKAALAEYYFSPNCLVDDRFHLWHYPGTHSEISRVLTEIGGHHNGGLVKLPAFLDFHPIRQVVNNGQTTIYYSLAIAASTNSKWLTEKRETQVFDRLLRPIYDEFIQQIDKCGYFRKDYGAPPHTKYEVFTTGNNQGVIVDRYGEHIDAIELHNLQLTLKNSLCSKDFERIETENESVTTGIEEILNS